MLGIALIERHMVVQPLPPHLFRRLGQHLLRKVDPHHPRLRYAARHEYGQIARTRRKVEDMVRPPAAHDTHDTPPPYAVDRQRQYVVQAVVCGRNVVEHALHLLLLAHIGRIVRFHI